MPRQSRCKELPKLYKFICEDEKSMKYYIEGFAKYVRLEKNKDVIVQVKSVRGKTSFTQICRFAKNELKELKRKNNGSYGEYKVIPCFDKDNNNISKIKGNIIQNKNMYSVFNNPCYEYWLLLHTCCTGKNYTTSKQCEEECMKAINKTYHTKYEDLDKFKSEKNIFNIVKNDLMTAITNAKSLNFEELDSTYTNTHIILEEIMNYKK